MMLVAKQFIGRREIDKIYIGERLVYISELLEFNNIFVNGNFENSDGWYMPSITYNISNNELIITSLSSSEMEICQFFDILEGHTYYLRCGVLSSVADSERVVLSGGSEYYRSAAHSGSGNYEILSCVFTAQADIIGASVRALNSVRSGDISANPVKIKNAMFIDITELAEDKRVKQWCDTNITPDTVIW